MLIKAASEAMAKMQIKALTDKALCINIMIRELSLIRGRGGLQIFYSKTHFVSRPSLLSTYFVLWPSQSAFLFYGPSRVL